MTRSILLLVALVAAGETNAARTIEYIERGYEISLADLDLPPSAVGMVSLRPCSNCERVSLPVNASTEYSFYGAAPLTFTDFQLAISRLRATARGGESGVGVYYDLSTKRVTRVIVLSAK